MDHKILQLPHKQLLNEKSVKSFTDHLQLCPFDLFLHCLAKVTLTEQRVNEV